MFFPICAHMKSFSKRKNFLYFLLVNVKNYLSKFFVPKQAINTVDKASPSFRSSFALFVTNLFSFITLWGIYIRTTSRGSRIIGRNFLLRFYLLDALAAIEYKRKISEINFLDLSFWGGFRKRNTALLEATIRGSECWTNRKENFHQP